jgi:hypothetical protein
MGRPDKPHSPGEPPRVDRIAKHERMFGELRRCTRGRIRLGERHRVGHHMVMRTLDADRIGHRRIVERSTAR